MADLPTGTVTFLFTDIEGSTRLLQELGNRYPALLDEHGEVVRRAIAGNDGVEVSTQGDSFFVVFRSPVAAVQAAVAAQRDLAACQWPLGVEVRVRMGVHTGEGALGGQDYIGIDVNRAARVADAAHGGQILVSDATRALVDHSLPEGVSLQDLGEHRLKDIDRPERLYHLVVDGLRTQFPPPRSIDARPNNLPAQLTSFVGREQEIDEVRTLLDRSRLLTLTGPGGSGKTRLSLEVAAAVLTEYRDGAFFVDLSSVTDPALVPAVIAHALGVPEVAGRSILEGMKEHLRDRELLLVVDNFEQVVEAGRVVEELLTAARRLKVMVTSRIVLSLRGEQEYAVPPLEPPDPQRLPDLTTLRRFEAVQLFTERALAVVPGFRVTEGNAPAVAEITARLDGLPLAIELAATRTKVLTPEQMLPRLQDSLSLLTSGGRTLPERQRTLRGAIAWSHDLLDERERGLFARLSVFRGGWSLESAEAVGRPEELGLDALDGLSALVDMSLVRRSELADGSPRFSMLETIREFGQERLRAGDDLDVTRERHGEHFLDLAIEAEPHLTAEEQGTWLDLCDREHPNIRAALQWAIEAGRVERAQQAAGALWRFWQQRGHLAEGRRWLDELLALPEGQAATAARAAALIGAGGVAWWQQDREAAGRCYAEAVEVERKLGSPSRIAEALYNLSFVVAGEDMDAAGRLLDEALELFRRVGDERGVAQVQALLVMPEAQAGAWDSVVARLEEVEAIWRRLGERLHLAFDLLWVAFARGRLGRMPEAWSAGLEALEIFRSVDNQTGIGIAFIDLAFLANWDGRHEDALRLAAVSESLKERVGGPPGAIGGLLEGDPVADAREHLPADAAELAWEEGRAMSVDEAVAVAERRD
jgi:predicted ATPase/class 3 adenylate cyclase